MTPHDDDPTGREELPPGFEDLDLEDLDATVMRAPRAGAPEPSLGAWLPLEDEPAPDDEVSDDTVLRVPAPGEPETRRSRAAVRRAARHVQEPQILNPTAPTTGPLTAGAAPPAVARPAVPTSAPVPSTTGTDAVVPVATTTGRRASDAPVDGPARGATPGDEPPATAADGPAAAPAAPARSTAGAPAAPRSRRFGSGTPAPAAAPGPGTRPPVTPSTAPVAAPPHRSPGTFGAGFDSSAGVAAATPGPDAPIARDPRKRPDRRMLVLVAAAVAAVLVAIVVFGVLLPANRRNGQAREAAQAYQSSAQKWREAWTPEALAPFLSPDTALLTTGVSALGADLDAGNLARSALEGGCAKVDGLSTGLAALAAAPPPTLSTLRSEQKDYLQAKQDATANAAVHAAAADLLGGAGARVDALMATCSYTKAELTAGDAKRTALAAWAAAHTVPEGETERDGAQSVRCAEPGGCLPAFDWDARRAAAEPLDAAAKALADAAAPPCPVAGLQAACTAAAAPLDATSKAYTGLATALREEDPATGTGRYEAALAALADASASQAAADATIAEVTGKPTLGEAFAAEALTAAGAVGTLAAKVTPLTP